MASQGGLRNPEEKKEKLNSPNKMVLRPSPDYILNRLRITYTMRSNSYSSSLDELYDCSIMLITRIIIPRGAMMNHSLT